VRVEQHGEGLRGGVMTTQSEASIGELFKRLGTDTGSLIRQEAALAKAELREVGTTMARDGARIGIAAGLAFVGALALTAFLVVGLGVLLGGAYWLSALIVGAVAFGVGAVLARNAVGDIKRRGLTPRQTIETIKEDKAWAAQQARELKHDLTSDPNSSPTRK
jgi:hypothetical protein